MCMYVLPDDVHFVIDEIDDSTLYIYTLTLCELESHLKKCIYGKAESYTNTKVQIFLWNSEVGI